MFSLILVSEPQAIQFSSVEALNEFAHTCEGQDPSKKENWPAGCDSFNIYHKTYKVSAVDRDLRVKSGFDFSMTRGKDWVEKGLVLRVFDGGDFQEGESCPLIAPAKDSAKVDKMRIRFLKYLDRKSNECYKEEFGGAWAYAMENDCKTPKTWSLLDESLSSSSKLNWATVLLGFEVVGDVTTP